MARQRDIEFTYCLIDRIFRQSLGEMADFSGSRLPYGSAQVERPAAPVFDLVPKHSGRLDYIETIRQWCIRFARLLDHYRFVFVKR